MSAPDYNSYSLGELHQVLNRIDKERFPDRVQLIENEIKKREEMGEILAQALQNPLWRQQISFVVTLKIWWAYFWRTTIAVVVVSLILGFLLAVLNKFLGFDERTIKFIGNVIGMIGGLIISILFLNHALAKKYSNFIIHIVKEDKSNKSLKHETAQSAAP